MKKLTAILITAVILFSNLGLAFNVHYCHDKIASVSIDYSVQNDNSNCCCVKKDAQKKCCSDTTIKAEKKSDDFLVKSFQLDLQQFITLQQFDFNFQKQIVSVKQQNLIENYSEANSPPLYKLYCQFVLYA